jgi:hypothetical protein
MHPETQKPVELPLPYGPKFCVDEKSAIQALTPLHLLLPMSPGRIERHGFEYYRHGITTARFR